ncbi:Succinyl-CoA:coenzyme A transferase [bacterium YEK0313]|nr:Succinyl-CoA:coenzyme A transferase [bacterium YEK0313]
MTAAVSAKRATAITAAEAAALVKSGMWLDYGFGMGQPDLFDRALAARRDELSDVKIRSALTMKARPTQDSDPQGAHFHWFSWHFSGYDRARHDEGRCNYIPMNFGEAPDYYRRFIEPVDIVVLKTCPMDADGVFNFGGAATYQRATVERARCVIVEVCEAMPYCHGPDNGVHVSEVDFVIQGDGEPIPVIGNPAPTDVDRKVAEQIVGEIAHGACLQIGIGGMPNAVCATLKDSGVRDLGIHTEMMSDGIISLYEAGLVTGARKTIDRGKMVYTFAAGSQRQYEVLNHNSEALCYPVDYTNLPHNIMQNAGVVSINNTTQIDLQGQAASESDGHRHLSGTGGQLQFVRGAYASDGGKSFLCMSSTYDKRGDRRSRIVLNLTPGNVVTTPRTDTMYVVTEFGMVNLKGKSVAERAKALISIAHPDFREGLERQAREHGLMPKGLTLR